MRASLLAVLLLLSCLPAQADGRVPLGGRDAGLYVGLAGNYMLGKTPFSFSIDQVSRKSDPVVLGKSIERLHVNGKRSILDIFLYESGDEQAKPAAEYWAWLDPLLSKLPLDKVYAITLSEENIYWNGHQQLLADLYRQVKAKYPDLAVYQWYSPGAGAPGFGWPLLPADGWLIDEYCRPRAEFERMVKQYLLLDKPLIHIAWAAPGWKDFSTWDKVWDDQLEICRRYGVPISFFCWWPPDSTPPPPGNQSMWSWSAPPGTEHHRVWNEVVLPYVQRLRQGLPARQSPDLSTGQMVPVAGDEQGQFTYHESFRPSPRFLDDADLTGFTALRWTGERLEVKPDRLATLTYRFASPFDLHRVRAAVKGNAPDSSVSLGISADGKRWAEVSSADNAAAIELPEHAGLRQFVVRVELSGKRKWPATLEDLLVAAQVDPPVVPQVTLTPAADGTVSFSDDFRSQLYLHVGRVAHAEDLKWTPGQLRMFGKQGYAVEGSVDYHFVCAQPLQGLTATLDCSADKSDFGSSVELALSRDGVVFEPKAATDAEGKQKFRGALTVRAAEAEVTSKDFWVRVTLRNTCGAATTMASPCVQRLTVTGSAVR